MEFDNLLVLLMIIFTIGLFALDFYPKEKVCFEDTKDCFWVDVVDNVEGRQNGLMDVKFLGGKEGMLFVFPETGNYSFWMKNTLIELDIVWVNSEKKVAYIEHSALPCLVENCEIYNPEVESKYVLEVRGGRMNELGIVIGEEINELPR